MRCFCATSCVLLGGGLDPKGTAGFVVVGLLTGFGEPGAVIFVALMAFNLGSTGALDVGVLGGTVEADAGLISDGFAMLKLGEEDSIENASVLSTIGD